MESTFELAHSPDHAREPAHYSIPIAMHNLTETKLVRHEFAYLILSHGELDQVIRLMKTIRIGSPLSAILLHHDAKNPAPDEEMLQRLNVQLVSPRISAAWGDFSLVDAVLNSVSYTLRAIDFDWLVVLSGQDYPLRPFSTLESELRNSPYDAFVKATPVSMGPYGFRYYMRYWKLPKMPFIHRLPSPIQEILGCAQKKLSQSKTWLRIQPGPRNTPTRLGLGIFGHPFSNTFVCHKGSQWFTLSKRAAAYLIQFGQKQPNILGHYRQTLIPDESYFQTVLWNAKDLRVCEDHRRFILWDDAKLAHPVTLTMQHYDSMIQSGKDFGRKFDMAVDAKVLDALDQVVLGPQHTESKHGANNVFPAQA